MSELQMRDHMETCADDRCTVSPPRIINVLGDGVSYMCGGWYLDGYHGEPHKYQTPQPARVQVDADIVTSIGEGPEWVSRLREIVSNRRSQHYAPKHLRS